MRARASPEVWVESCGVMVKLDNVKSDGRLQREGRKLLLERTHPNAYGLSRFDFPVNLVKP